MNKYVIVQEYTSAGEEIYVAYQKIWNYWGLLTLVPGTGSDTAEKCEERLRDVLDRKRGKVVIKEIEFV